ncbi:MAG: adenylate/guanylate cyclase domain-containing protein [Kofleriaceae bacterium]|nr:adenylate/guanylate cyclase domain-containing protein [Kofleriaceae bacterium]
MKKSWNAFGGVQVKPLVREVSLDNLPLEIAYEVDGVHVYLDLPNALTLLGDDGERAHARLLRFLHILMRVAHLVFQRTDAVKVDLQSTRLHFVIFRPYDSAAARVRAAVAIAALLRDALLAGNALHGELSDARVVVGIESGKALAVRNGTRGDREPLFLGNPANHAAKLTGTAKSAGIYLGTVARSALGPAFASANPSANPLSAAQIEACSKEAKLAVTRETVSRAWDEERKDHPISTFEFSRITPPLSGFDLDRLSPSNTKRQELVVMYGDIDGFTKYVSDAIATGRGATAVRVLHLIRKELRDVLNDFGGRKLRYIGDCIQGLIANGTAFTTDAESSVLDAVMCASAMRSAFSVIRTEVPDASSLGLQIGLELGPVAVTRLGVQGSRDRCVIGTASTHAERAQADCKGNETAIGIAAYGAGPQLLRDAFGPTRKSTEIDFDRLAARLDRARSSSAARYGAGPSIPNAVRPRAYCE